ncbi:MAG: AbrB/MazE/SpoVT family DNA-binding domain-containing protein [Dethiobacter sp.]|nr:AbrB/MazE/SpoVT family DNA-binding domain-containing protein [Dethiobacter sp.]
MYTTRISSRGQIVIPKYYRDKLKIAPNAKIIFSEKEGQLLLSVLPEDPVAEARGMLKKNGSLADIVRENRMEELSREKK